MRTQPRLAWGKGNCKKITEKFISCSAEGKSSVGKPHGGAVRLFATRQNLIFRISDRCIGVHRYFYFYFGSMQSDPHFVARADCVVGAVPFLRR